MTAAPTARTLRVSIVTETYFPLVNGVSRTLERLLFHLLECGDQVQLLTPRFLQGEPATRDGVSHLSFPATPLPLYPEISLSWVRPRILAEQLAGFEPDVVHIATEGPLGCSALAACKRKQLPVISSYHTHFPRYLGFYRLGLLAPLAWRYLRHFRNRTAVTLCPTPSVRRELLENGIERVKIWSRGVDTRRYSPDKRRAEVRRDLGVGEREVAVLYAGRLAPEKNLDLLLDAFQLVVGRFPARLLLVGDGPQRAELEKRAGPQVIFTGYRRGEDLARVYAACDVFAFPSLTETFGNVLPEAMASGLPVAGFRATGPVDVVAEGVSGLIAREPSALALAEVLCHLLGDPETRRKMGASARQYALEMTWDEVNSTTRELYLETAMAVSRPGLATWASGAPG